MTEINIRVTTTPPATVEVLNPEGPQGEQGPQGPQGVPGTPGLDAANSPYNIGLTGSVARTVDTRLADIVSVKDFGATGDGTTDDTAAVQAALDASLAVYFPAGVYSCGTLTIRSGHQIGGAGYEVATVVSRAGTNGNGLFATGVSGISLTGICIDGNSANNTTGNGIRLEGTSGNITVKDCRFTDWAVSGVAIAGTVTGVMVQGCLCDANTVDGIAFTGVQRAQVTGNRLTNNGRFGVVFGAGSHNSQLVGNILAGNTVLDASGCGALAISCTDITFSGNTAEGNTQGHGLQFNTVTRGTMSGNTSRGNGISGLDSFASTHVTITGNVSYDNDVRGIEIDSGAFYNTVSGNVVDRNGGAGISVYRTTGAVVSNNISRGNGMGLPVGLGLPPEPYGIRLWDDANTQPPSNCRLIGNSCIDDRGVGFHTQTHGISIEAASTSDTTIIGNQLTPNITGPIRFDGPTVDQAIERARDNQGWATQNEGTASIPSGSTSVVVNHGLAVTPTASDIMVTGTNGPTNAIGPVFVNNVTATQFTLNCRTDPGAGGANFRWRASKW